MRKVFLDELPRWESGKNKGKINWKESVGCKVKFIYDDIEGKVEIINYYSKDKNKDKNLVIKYKNKESFIINIDSFKRCQLGKLLGKITSEFKIEIGQIFKDDKRDLIIIDREIRDRNRKDKKLEKQKHYKYKCNKCGYDEGWIEESNLLKGEGCACCRLSPQIVVENINSIVANPETWWMIPYFQGGYDEAKLYTKSSGKKIRPICPDCGRVKDKKMMVNTIYNNKSIGCKNCGDGYSYGHKYIFNLLTQLNQDFQDNKTFDWCKFYNPYKDKEVTGEYDFVIEHNKLIIEVDGDFHRKDNRMNGQTKEESKFLDNEKDKVANNNGYEVIRIDYDDKNMNVKRDLTNSKINNLFDLSNIDWLKCEDFALKSRVKDVCEIKMNNPEITVIEISKIINISKSAITKYLKKGTKLGWCNYDPKEESFKSSSKSGKSNGKPVEVFKDEISLGIFESCADLARQSDYIFGTNFCIGNISEVCLGRKPQYKGFTFKYITETVNK